MRLNVGNLLLLSGGISELYAQSWDAYNFNFYLFYIVENNQISKKIVLPLLKRYII